MSTRGPVLYHPVDGTARETWQGFSWPAFLFSGFWTFAKGLWIQGILAWVIAIFSVGWAVPVVWLVYGFCGNRWHHDRLVKEGYLPEAPPRGGHADAPVILAERSVPADVTDKLAQLTRLREMGLISETEFATQKRALIG